MLMRILRSIVVCFGLLVLGGLAAPAQAQGTPWILGYQPRTPAPNNTIELTLPPGMAQARLPLFLSYTGDTPVTGVRLYAVLLQGIAGPPLPDVIVQWLDPGQPDGTLLGSQDWNKDDPASQVLLSVSNVPAGTYTGTIGVEIGGSSQTIATLRVVSPTQPAVNVTDAVDGVITLHPDSNTLDATILVVENGGLAPAKVQISQGVAFDANGNQLLISAAPSTFDLAAHGFQAVHLSSPTALTIGTVYNGALRLQFDQQATADLYTLHISRQHSPVLVDLTVTSPDTAMRWFPVGASSVLVGITLHEKAGRPAALPLPGLLKLVDSVDESGGCHSWTLWDAQHALRTGQTCPPTADSTGANRLATPGAALSTPLTAGSQAVPELSLGPGETRNLLLEIRDLGHAGHYAGIVRLDAVEGTSQDATFSVRVKDNFPIALLCLLLGVALSYWTRFWTGRGRNQARQTELISSALDDAHAALQQPHDSAMYGALAARLQRLQDSVGTLADADVDAELAKIRIIRENYLAIRAILVLRSGDILSQLFPTDQADGFDKRLKILQDRLESTGIGWLATDNAAGNKLLTDTQSLYNEVASAAQARLNANQDQLRQAVNVEQTTLVAASVPAAVRTALQTRFADLLANLVAAPTALSTPAAGTAASDLIMLAAQTATYNRLRAAFLPLHQALNSALLRSQIENTANPPAGFTAANWPSHKQAWLDALGPTDSIDKSAAAFPAALELYLRDSLTALQSAITIVQAAPQRFSDHKPIANDLATRARSNLIALGRVQAQVKTDVAAAQTAYTQLLAAFEQVYLVYNLLDLRKNMQEFFANLLKTHPDQAEKIREDVHDLLRDAEAGIKAGVATTANAQRQQQERLDRLQQQYDTINKAVRVRAVSHEDFIPETYSGEEGATQLHEVLPPPGLSLLGQLFNPAQSSGVPPDEQPRLPDGTLLRIPKLIDIRRHVLWSNAVLIMITLAVAVVLGLLAQWVANPTFGTWENYINAFLWGFGLSKLTEAGLATAADRLGLNAPETPFADPATPPKK